MTSSTDQLPLFATELAPAHKLEGSSRSDVLVTLARAAAANDTASRRLEAAVVAAHRAGWSWRQIGGACKLPHQTLHRRYRGLAMVSGPD